MEKWDAIVIGGGPAGCEAARECAVRGLRTLLLERSRLPREKPCGGGVSLAAEKLLAADLPPRVAEVRCRFLRTLHGGWKRELVYPYPFLASVRRAALDAYLLERAVAAGVTVRETQEAEGVEAGALSLARAPEVEVRVGSGRLLATGVVVADGVTGKISRRLRGPWSSRDLALCFTAEAEGDEHRDDPFRREGIEVHYAFVPMGYGWLFPKSDRLYVGVGAYLPAATGLGQAFAEFVRRNRLRLCSSPRAALVPVGGGARVMVGDGWLLAGDAAGLADPFSGEGIRYAIASGQMAAATLATCLGRGRFPSRAALLEYPRRFRRIFGSHLAMGRLLFALLHRFPGALLGIYFRHDEPFRRTLDMLAGKATYGSLLGWVLPRLPFLALTGSPGGA